MSLRSLRLVEIVRLATQKPFQALVLCTVFFISDLTSWLSLAIMTVLLLRKGLQSIVFIFLILAGMQFLPGLGTRAIDFLVMLTLLLAGQLLRTTVRLDVALMLAGVIGSVSVGLVHSYADHLLDPFFQVFTELNRSFPELSTNIKENSSTYVLRVICVLVVLKASLILLLARYWQSVLFNPQGFGAEFLRLRMPIFMTFFWGMAVFLMQFLPEPLKGLSSGLNLAMLLAGIATCHWGFTRFSINVQWRVLFYLSLVIIYPLMVLVGVMDSFTDIRQRLAANGSKNGA